MSSISQGTCYSLKYVIICECSHIDILAHFTLHSAFPSSSILNIWFHILHILIPTCLLGPAATSAHCPIFVLSNPRTPWQGSVML